jgi:hypothetical protein
MGAALRRKHGGAHALMSGRHIPDGGGCEAHRLRVLCTKEKVPPMEYDRGRVPWGGAAVSERHADHLRIAAPAHPFLSISHTLMPGLAGRACAHPCAVVRVRGIGPTGGHAGSPAERYYDMLNPPSLPLPNPYAKRAGARLALGWGGDPQGRGAAQLPLRRLTHAGLTF